jgi:hypothetical protein
MTQAIPVKKATHFLDTSQIKIHPYLDKIITLIFLKIEDIQGNT